MAILLPEGKYAARIINHDVTTIGRTENPAFVIDVLVGLGIKKENGEPHDGEGAKRTVAYWLENDGMTRVIDTLRDQGWSPESLDLLGSEHYESSPLREKDVQLVIYHKNGHERFFINTIGGKNDRSEVEKKNARQSVLSRFSSTFKAENLAQQARRESALTPGPF